MISNGVAVLASGLLAFAGGPIECTVSKTPVINIVPQTQEVRYDFSESSDQLTATKTDTVSPYAAGTRTVTEGLRRDEPKITMNMTDSELTYPDTNVMCMTYNIIDVHIDLAPVILIASEWPPGTCRDTIIGHEEKHIQVDHEVMNDFAQKIGTAVQNAVNQLGAVGPINAGQRDETRTYMGDYIDSAIKAQILPLYSEMRRAQAQVDTLEEYQRVAAICDKSPHQQPGAPSPSAQPAPQSAPQPQQPQYQQPQAQDAPPLYVPGYWRKPVEQ